MSNPTIVLSSRPTGGICIPALRGDGRPRPSRSAAPQPLRVPRPCRGFSFATGRGWKHWNNANFNPVEFDGFRKQGRLLLGGAALQLLGRTTHPLLGGTTHLLLGGAALQRCIQGPKRSALAAEVRFAFPRLWSAPIQSLPLTSAAKAAVSVAVNAALKRCSTQMPLSGCSVLVASATEPALSLPKGICISALRIPVLRGDGRPRPSRSAAPQLLGGAALQRCIPAPDRAALAAEVRFAFLSLWSEPIKILPLTSAAKAAVSLALNAALKRCSTQKPRHIFLAAGQI